jgi:extracellular elastinolytic metalloproteinase
MNGTSRADALAIAERHFGSGREIQLDPHVHETFCGDHIVHGQQQHRGLSVFPHSFVITIAADGSIRRDGDDLLDVASVPVIPAIGPEQAVESALRHLRTGTGARCHTAHERLFRKVRYSPAVVAAFPMPNRPTVVTQGPFAEPVQLNLVLLSGERLALAWLITLVIDRVGDFTIAVSAAGRNAGKVLYCALEAASACRGTVYLFNPDEAGPVVIDFPRPVADYPAGIRPASFRNWVERDLPFGNNVEMLFGNQDPDTRATAIGGGNLEFRTTPGTPQELVVNAFYLCNWLHDFFSLIGFGEADGNFQEQNFSGLGRGKDRLRVNVLPEAHGNANMRAQNDGRTAELSLGVWRNADGTRGRPTALDADIVIHEYAHGVSQRLVGGRLKQKALNEPQSLAMGEAWSDYFAITIQNHARPAPRFTFGAYSSRIPRGIRPTEADPAPYDQFDPQAAHFGRLGSAALREQHSAGSVFAAALIAMHTGLCNLLGRDAGQETAWKLVTDSLKKVKANPTFLEGREKLVESIRPAHPQRTAIEAIVRGAFARFGMGRNATCRDTSFTNIQPDFNA